MYISCIYIYIYGYIDMQIHIHIHTYILYDVFANMHGCSQEKALKLGVSSASQRKRISILCVHTRTSEQNAQKLAHAQANLSVLKTISPKTGLQIQTPVKRTQQNTGKNMRCVFFWWNFSTVCT